MLSGFLSYIRSCNLIGCLLPSYLPPFLQFACLLPPCLACLLSSFHLFAFFLPWFQVYTSNLLCWFLAFLLSFVLATGYFTFLLSNLLALLHFASLKHLCNSLFVFFLSSEKVIFPTPEHTKKWTKITSVYMDVFLVHFFVHSGVWKRTFAFEFIPQGCGSFYSRFSNLRGSFLLSPSFPSSKHSFILLSHFLGCKLWYNLLTCFPAYFP